MNIKKNILIVNNCPAFYKINLYNRLSEKINLHVVFLGLSNQVVAGNSFENKIKFSYTLINEFQVEKRSYFKTFLKLLKIVKLFKPSHIIYGGYIEPEFLLLSFLVKKNKNILQTETASETVLHGCKFWVKVLLLSRYQKAIVSGKTHKKMLEKMKYNGEIYISKGVGIIDKNQKNELKKSIEGQLRFLYVGRLIELKNLKLLVEVFNKLKLPLTIVGDGLLKNDLKLIAKDNIKFIDFVENSKIGIIYQSNDVFILPSFSEAWGLVLEEALFYGLPIVASNRVGSIEELVNEFKTGVTFDPMNPTDLEEAVLEMCNNFEVYKNNIEKFKFDEKDLHQINTYLEV